MEMNGYLHVPDTLSQRKRAPYTPVVGLTAGLDVLQKKKSLALPWNQSEIA
jgi:hypothetical protein